MPQPLVVDQSLVVAATPSEAFNTMLYTPITTVLSRWHGPIGPVKEVHGQAADWGEVGASRTLIQAGGGSVRETLTNVAAPTQFNYGLTDLTGPLSRLVTHVDGKWTFDSAGSGTRIVWQWTLHPRSKFTAPALPAFAALWRGYARKSLAELAKQLPS